MNTTLDFIKSFNSDNMSSVIRNFFDEAMVLYNLVGDRQDLDICVEDNTSIATFIILMDSEIDAKILYNNLNQTHFSVYDNTYYINMSLSHASITTTVTSVLSRATSD